MSEYLEALEELVKKCEDQKAEIIGLHIVIERLKTELADTKRVYGNADSTNEQKFVMLEKYCEGLEGAIKEAIWMHQNSGASEFSHLEYGPVYTVDPASFDEIAEILRKAVGQ